MARILMVDDDRQTRLVVGRFLEENGYTISSAGNGIELLEVLANDRVDLVILDVMLPGKSGLELCRELRERDAVPIIMLTARGDEADRVVGLEMGADDYLCKPFSPRELLARIRAVLRRRGERVAEDFFNWHHGIAFDGWRLDIRRRELIAPDGAMIDISNGEFEMLLAFLQHPNRILTRDQLLEYAKSRTSTPIDRTVDVQISRLRKKFESYATAESIIKTVRGAGYMFLPRVSKA